MLRLPKLPLSMTAVAVVTPSSGSNSAAVLLLWVVGADTCPSLFVARGPRGRLPSDPVRSPLVAIHAVAGPVRPVFDRSPREVPRCGGRVPGSHYRGPEASADDDWSPALVRRVPHERGDRPGGRSPRRAY